MLINVTQALGEMAIVFPVSGGFYTLAVRFIDPSWGELENGSRFHCAFELIVVGQFFRFCHGLELRLPMGHCLAS